VAPEGPGGAGGRRAWAWVALAALLLLVLGGLVALAAALPDVAVFGMTALVNAAVLATAGWWAFTTRRAWKRRLNLVIAGLAALLLVVDVVWFGLSRVLWVAGLVALLLAYVLAAHRALAGAAPAEADERPAPRRPWLLVNPRSGDGKAAKLDLAGAAGRRGVTVRLLEPGEDPAALARAAVAAGADSVGMAGGDGSLGAVAAVAVEHDLPFVCVPTGTRNHFAYDLGLDRTAPLTALDAYGERTGRERRVDLAAVGERLFLNNVSLGSYAAMVHEPGYRAAKLATAHATLPADLRGQPVRQPLSLRDPADRLHSGPFLLLVANNVYDVRPPMRVGGRRRLDGGVLQVSALYPGTEQGAALVRLAAQLAVRRTPEEARWTQWTATSVRVDSPVQRVRAGVDGEAVELPAPLDFRSLPGALRVRVPWPSAVPADARLLSRATVSRLWTVARGRGGPG
jgi:diacylglycerol kinase family enzyme